MHVLHQLIAGTHPDAMPGPVIYLDSENCPALSIWIVLIRGAIKDAFGGLLHAVQVPPVDVVGVFQKHSMVSTGMVTRVHDW